MTHSELLTLGAKALARFEVFSPKGVTFRSGPGLYTGVPFNYWSHTLWGETSKVIYGFSEFEGITAGWPKDVDFYPFYEEEYRILLSEDSSKKGYLRFETKEELEMAAQEGLLLSLHDSQGLAGLIAGKERDYYGVHALYIFEILLAKRLRGRGIARWLEARFVRGLKDRFHYVYGYIHQENQPSLRTAISVGRRIIESEYFFSSDVFTKV